MLKPLPSAPLTEEDRSANFEFAVTRRGCCWIAQLLCDSWDQDRRDAQLMFHAQRRSDLGLLWPYEIFGTGWPRDIDGAFGPGEFGGYLVRGRDITNCA